MKVFLTVVFVILAVDYSSCIKKKDVKLPPEAANALIIAVQQCMSGNNVPIESLLQVYQGGYSNDKNFKDFIYCCYKNAGYLKPDGRMNIEKSAKLFNDPAVIDGLKRCGEKPGKSAKEAVFNFFKCFQDTVPVRFTL